MIKKRGMRWAGYVARMINSSLSAAIPLAIPGDGDGESLGNVPP
jgi:hypothetical protein